MRVHHVAWLLATTFTSMASSTLVPASSCKPANAPTDASVPIDVAPVKDLCTLLEGIDSSGTIETICATAEEIVQVVSFIMTLRAQGSLEWPGSCTKLPTTEVCATSREIGKGIEYLVTKRAAVFFLNDGGK